MKIGFITASVSRNAGGLYESVRRLAQSMEGPASPIEVFGLEDEHTAFDLPAWAPLPVRAFPVIGPRRLGYAPRLFPALRERGLEVVMSHGLWMYSSWAVYKWHRKTRRPHIVHPHGMLDWWAVKNSRWKKWLALAFYERRHLESAACIRALCEAEAQAIRARGLKNPICVIPNGVDLPEEKSRLTSDERDHASAVANLKAAGRKVLLYLGRIHPKKGLANLVRAWASLRQSQLSTHDSRVDQWVLAIAGWDQNSHEPALKRLCDELGVAWEDINNRSAKSAPVSFLGPQFNAAKADCYRSCDAFILPSFSEGLPMALLEAWAYAKPVLMTPACNLPEGFDVGAAVRIEPRTGKIVDGLREFFAMSRESQEAMGRRGKDLAMARFNWNRIGSEMRAVAAWVLGKGATPDSVRHV